MPTPLFAPGRWPGAPAIRIVRDVLVGPDLGPIQRGWALSGAGGLVCLVAMLAYTFEVGGATLVAAYGIARTMAPAVVTPWALGLVGRLRREDLLRWSVAARAILLTGAAGGIALHLHPAAPIGLVAAAAALSGLYRPLQASMFPWLAHTPVELAASNATATLMENAAALLGPAIAGLVLVLADPGVALAVAAATMWAAALMLRPVRLPDESRSATAGAPSVWGSVPRGAAALLTVLRPGGLLVLATIQTFARGVLMVLVVVLAVQDLGIGAESVGWLTATIGLGGLAGAAITVATIRMTRLGRAFAAGVALWGLALVLLWVWPVPAVAYLAFAIVGVGNAIEDASAFTLVPRVVGEAHATAALGVLELAVLAAAGLGALVAPGLATALGTTTCLGVLGAAILAGAGLWARPSVLLDRSTRPPGPAFEVIRANPMFAPLPVVTLERLAEGARVGRHRPGEVILTEGERGDSGYLSSRVGPPSPCAAPNSPRSVPETPSARSRCCGMCRARRP